MNVEIRTATSEDMPSVLELIQELADYENAPDEVVVTVDQLTNDGFGQNKVFDAQVAVINQEIVGFALYYTGYSTWKGRTLYLEDFVIKEALRGKGIGKLLFEKVISIAKSSGAQRMDWQVLDWNDPAINFYKKYNAELDPEWLNGRFYKKDLDEFNFH